MARITSTHSNIDEVSLPAPDITLPNRPRHNRAVHSEDTFPAPNQICILQPDSGMITTQLSVSAATDDISSSGHATITSSIREEML